MSTRSIMKHRPRFSESHRPSLTLSIPGQEMATKPIVPSAMARPVSPSVFPFAYTSLSSPHVHFPPTPAMTCTFAAHSPATYDRAPIIVSPNICSLPERGCRVLYSTSPARSRTVSTPRVCVFDAVALQADEAHDNDDDNTLAIPPSALMPNWASKAEFLSLDPQYITATDSFGIPVVGASKGSLSSRYYPKSPYPKSPSSLSTSCALPLEEFAAALGVYSHNSSDKNVRTREAGADGACIRNHRRRRSVSFSRRLQPGCLGGF